MRTFRFYGVECLSAPCQLHRVYLDPCCGRSVTLKVIEVASLSQGIDERGNYVEVEELPRYIDLSSAEARRLAQRLMTVADESDAFDEEISEVD